MAHAYTTKRGKNKIAKLGVRKDHQQNSERQLKSKSVDIKYEGPKESIGGSLGRLANHRINQEAATKAAARAAVAPRIMDKCSNPECSNPECEISKLAECSVCLSVRYCKKACQLAHWPSHKAKCKEIKQARIREEEETDKILKQIRGETNEDSSDDSDGEGVNEGIDIKKVGGDGEKVEQAKQNDTTN